MKIYIKDYKILSEKSKLISDMMDSLDVSYDEIDFNLDINQDELDLLIDCLEKNYIPDINYKQLSKLLLICNFLMIEDLYKLCCLKLYKKIRFKKADELLNMYDITGEDYDFMINNKNFTDDLWSKKMY